MAVLIESSELTPSNLMIFILQIFPLQKPEREKVSEKEKPAEEQVTAGDLHNDQGCNY